MAEDRDDASGRLQWFLKRRTGPEGTYAPDQILKASQVRHQQLRQQAESPLAFRPPGAAGSVNWTPIGPSAIRHGSPAGNPVVSGRITAICAGPDKRVYVGSANGGAWFSADRGVRWTPLDEWFWKAPVPPTEKHADSLSVGAIAVKFGARRKNDILFIGTGEPRGGDVGYFGVGIKVSTDGGQTFTLEGSGNLAGVGIYGLAIDPDGSNDPMAVAATTAGLYRRPASGQSRDNWIALGTAASSPATAVIVAGTSARSNKTYYAAFQTDDAKKVYSSTDNGASWTGIGGITTPKGRIALASENPSVVYALAYDAAGEPVLFRRDGNNDFTAVAFQPRTSARDDIHNLFGSKAGARQGDYDIAVAVSPANDNFVYLAGSGIYDANSATQNLALFACLIYSVSGILLIPTPSYIGLGMHSDGHCLAFETKADGTHDPSVLWVGTDGGPFCSTQSASPGTFIARNDGLAITQLTYFDDRADTDAVVISGCHDNGTVRFSGDAAWSHAGPGDGGGVAVDPNNVRRVMRQGTHADLMTCTDGALTDGFRSQGGSWRSLWDERKFPPVPDSKDGNTMRDTENDNCEFYTRIRAIDFGAGDTLAAFGTNRLWVTLDWGETWTTLPSGTNPLATPPGDFNRDGLIGSIVDIRLATATSIYVATTEFAYHFTYNNNAWRPSPPQWMLPLALSSGWKVSSIAVENDALGAFYLGCSRTKNAEDHVWYYDGTDWHGTRPTSGISIPDVPVNALAVDPADSNIIYVGTDVGVWKGTKQVVNTTIAWVWEIFSQGLPEAAVFDLAIHPKARLLRAATHGRGAWEIMLDATSGHDTDVYLRAHTADNGRRFSWAENVPDPTRSNGYATASASPDIRVCRGSQGMPSEPLDFAGFAALDAEARTLDPTGTNKIFVQVHNRGATTASNDTVTVLLLLANADNGVPPLPQDFADHIKIRDRNFAWLGGSGWKVADTTSPYNAPYKRLPGDLTARTPQVVSFNVDLSTWPLGKGSVCAVAFVSATNDPIVGSDAHVDSALATNKYMAAKLMQVASPSHFWRPGGTLANARQKHDADLLRSGGVFVAGGVTSGRGPVGTAEARNVFTNAWTRCGDIGNCRGATVLLDGRVLLVMVGSDNYFWDPSTGAVTRGPDRHGDTGGICTQLRLADGSVLLVAVNGSEVFDPVTNSWTVLQGAPTGFFYRAILLRDGRVVVQGISYVVGQPYRPLVYMFDPYTANAPSAANWTSVSQNTPLPAVSDASATYLSNGRVLFIGGTLPNTANPRVGTNAVVVLDPDPTNPTWSQLKPMPLPLMEHTATLLDDGTVLVVGGRNDYQMNCLSTVSRYDFATDSWQQEPPMTKPRALHTATKLPSGEVVIAGGYSSNYLGSEVADCEIYVPAVT